MSITLVTATLQDLVSKAVKGSSFVPRLPLTCLMEIKVKENKLYISTTDNVNNLCVFAPVQCEDFQVVVDSKLFSSLVNKLSTATTTLTIEDNKLIVQGNGKYNLPIPLDSDGTFVKFPQINIINNDDSVLVNNEVIKSILTLNKSCKAEMKESPSIYNYYCDNDKVLTTDFFKACYNPVKLFNSPLCLSPSILELVPYVCDENGVKVTIQGDDICFSSSSGVLTGKVCIREELEGFPIQELMTSFNETMPYSCKINRTLLINAIDRICLFVDVYTSNKITIIFDSNQITLHSDTTNSSESIIYLEPLAQDITPVSLKIDALFLKNQLSACNREDLVIKFGSDSGIQIICDKVNLLLSVLGDGE